jgi:hypothetical protein
MKRTIETSMPNPDGGRSAILTTLSLRSGFADKLHGFRFGGLIGPVLSPIEMKRG